jgi:hypothetical protein
LFVPGEARAAFAQAGAAAEGAAGARAAGTALAPLAPPPPPPPPPAQRPPAPRPPAQRAAQQRVLAHRPAEQQGQQQRLGQPPAPSAAEMIPPIPSLANKADMFDFDLLMPGDVVDSSGMFLEEPLDGRDAVASSAMLYYQNEPGYGQQAAQHISHHASSSGNHARSGAIGGAPVGGVAAGGGAAGAGTGARGGSAGARAGAGAGGRAGAGASAGGARGAAAAVKAEDEDEDDDDDDDDDDGKGGRKRGKSAIAGGLGGEDDGGEDDDEKKAKRRKQIAAASRMSRARRKRELEDLRDENERLREERSQFLAKIGELQLKVESLREQGSSDMRVENELLRAQLEEHKRFVSCFKRLSEGAPSSVNARHAIYRQGADTAHAHVLGLISQSQADDWQQATVPLEADLPYQNFSVFYKFKDDYGSASGGGAGEPGGRPARRRLNLRVDVLFPGIDAASLSDFFWDSFSNSATQQRLYNVKGVEVTQLTDDMPDANTKMLYYRERWEGEKDQDLVLICNRRRKELAKSTLGLPHANKAKPAVGKVAAVVMAMSTTQHSAAPEYENARRITSMFVQGAVMWNSSADSRLCVVFSFPDNVRLKAIHSIEDVLVDGCITTKFVDILKSYRNELGQRI